MKIQHRNIGAIWPTQQTSKGYFRIQLIRIKS